jgi:hypothetical protein
MKNFILPMLAVFVLSLYSCTTPRQTASRYSDDIYFSSKDVVAAKKQQRTQQRIYQDAQLPPANNQQQEEVEYYDPNQSGQQASQINNYYGNVNQFDYDDYYDYAYTSRIRRFHQPMGMGYYDPFYTNMYFYNHNPFMWGTSIYMGYNFWNPSPWGMGMGWGMGHGMGWGMNYGMGWGMNYGMGWGGGWGMGYGMGMGWGGPGYWSGYNHGYWNGYNHGLASTYYYNSFDQTIASNNNHYGPRGGSAAGGGSSGRSVTQQRSIGQLYQSSLSPEGVRGTTSTSKSDAIRNGGNTATNNATELPSRSSAAITNPDRSSENLQAAGTTRTNGQVMARPGRDGSAVDNSTRESISPSVNPGATRQSGATTTTREPVTTRSGVTPQTGIRETPATRGNAGASTQGAQQPSRQPIQPQTRSNIQPNPAQAAPRTSQPSQQQVIRQQEQNRQNIYNSPKRNPNTYQPSAQPGSKEGTPSYNRQPNFESPQQRGQGQSGYGNSRQPQQQPNFNNSQPSRQGNAQPQQPRQAQPSYSAPQRSSSPSYSAPSSGGGSRGGSSAPSAPSRGGSAPSGRPR